MSFNLAISNDYGRDYFVKSTDLGFLQSLMIRLSVPFFLPLLFKSLFVGSMLPANMANRTKDTTGVINCASSSVLKL
jgi:hypothetical protein